jgi:hypothetical protein
MLLAADGERSQRSAFDVQLDLRSARWSQGRGPRMAQFARSGAILFSNKKAPPIGGLISHIAACLE